MWRPEGWGEKYPDPCIDCDHDNRYLPGDVRHDSYCYRCGGDDEYKHDEEIADAMLEALKEGHQLMTPEQMKLLAPNRQWPYGWLVFIPEE